jgi:hypothetical protein
MTLTSTDHDLETGRRADTPDGDNLLLDFARLEAHGYRALAEAAGGRAEDDPALGLTLTDTRTPTPFGNLAHFVVPPPEGASAEIAARLRSFYTGPGGPFLVFSPWSSVDLGAHGFALVGHPPLMIRPSAAGTADLAPDRDLTLVTVETPAQLIDFEQTLVEGFPTPELLPFGAHPRLLGEGLLHSPWRLVVGYLDGRPVATAAAIAGARVGAVEMVSTQPDVRGRGYGRAVTAACPDTPSLLISSDSGRGVYGRLGYLPVLRYSLWIGHR